MGNRWHVIGEGKNPIYTCKKKDVPKLFTRTFWEIYDIWYYHHNGFGLPGGLIYSELDPDVLRALVDMEMYYENNFSMECVMIKYQEAILRTLRALGGKKRK
jgi:hypothetical protein